MVKPFMALDSEARQKKTRTRSPAYPYIDLRAALEKAAILWKAEGRHPAVVNVIMQHWGYKEESSTGFSCIAALKKFGLVDHEGMGDDRQIRLSNLALAILLDDDPNSRGREEALKTSALLPRIHSELWEKYGPDLPSDQSLKRFLVLERQFNEAAVDELLDEYKVTMSFAGLNRPNGGGPVTGPASLPTVSQQSAGGQNGLRTFGADSYERRDDQRRAETPANAFKPPQRPAGGAGGGWTAGGGAGGFPAPIHAAQHGTGGRLTRPETDYEEDEDDWEAPAPSGGHQAAGSSAPSFAGRPRPSHDPRMDHRLPERAERHEPSAQASQRVSSETAARDAAFWEEQRELLHVESRPKTQTAAHEAAEAPAAPIARKELPVPLDNDMVARVPYPMTEEDFLLLIETLQLWKKRLVRPTE